MSRTAMFPVLGVALLVASCSEPDPTAILPVFEESAAMTFAANGTNASVPLSGAEEVPPVATLARGTAIFHLSDDETTLHYRLIVANIENVVASHIHIAPAGTNGPVVTFLFGPAAPNGGRSDGVIAEGAITASNLVGPLAGGSLEDLLDLMAAGSAYVNVHTNDGVAPGNTGPGDFPGGEIRGQIR